MALVELVRSKSFQKISERIADLLENYFRVEIEGIEHIPRKGRAIICPNHSGFAGTDAIILAHVIREHTGRRPRILAHRAFFDWSRALKSISESFGLKKASITNGIEIMKRNHVMILFPEGEKGNFKSSLLRYRLQKFHTGFLRIAVSTQAPIIPCVIIGAEESHLNLGNINLSRLIKGLRIPLPVNFFPLPARWKIRFLPPFETQVLAPDFLDESSRAERLAKQIQTGMQKAIREELKRRPFIYSQQTRALIKPLL